MPATYLYAIIPTDQPVIFSVPGVDDDYEDVYTVPHDGIAAVVSSTGRSDYRQLKRQEAVRYLVTHQRVIEHVMQDFSLLPVKFGTVLPDDERAHQLLTQSGTLFRETLDKFATRVQMEVVALWNAQEVFQEIAQAEPVVQRKAQVVGSAPEETLAERVALGQLVQTLLEERRAALRSRLLPALHSVALDAVINPLMGDSMVLNVALLVDEPGRRQLDGQLEALDKEFGGRLNFRCVGPLPPYSFATVEVQMISGEAANAAWQHLDLGESATPDEIKRAYHRRVRQVHPDHNPSSPETESRMAALTQAYQLLMALAEDHAREGAIDREALGQKLLVSISRQEFP